MTSYWKSKTATTTSTTICRALVETAAHKACQEGDISPSQRDAINGINGHSGQISQDYYLFQDRKREVSLAVEGFQKIIGEPQPCQQEQRKGHELIDSEDEENQSFPVDTTDEEAQPYAVVDPWKGFGSFLQTPKPDMVVNNWNGFGEFLQNSIFSAPLRKQSPLISPPRKQHQWLMNQVNFDTQESAPSTPPANIVRSPLLIDSRTLTVSEKFGDYHPSKNSDTKRVQFSPFEVKYVGEFCAKLARESPYLCTRMFAECLEAIKMDKSVHPQFHPRHIESSDRLRPALILWERVNGKVMG